MTADTAIAEPMAAGSVRQMRERIRSAFGQNKIADREQELCRLRDRLVSGELCGKKLEPATVNALFYVLGSHDWVPSIAEFARALPHFPERFGLDEIRETCARIGLGSSVSKSRLRDIAPGQFPALIEFDGKIHAVDADDEGVPCLVSHTGGTLVPLPGNMHPASIVLFNGFADTDNFSKDGSSFLTLVGRFRGHLLLLLFVTFLINMVMVLSSLAVMAVYDWILPSRAVDTLVAMAIGTGLIIVIEIGFRKLRADLIGELAGRVDYLVSCLAFEKLLSLPYSMIKNSPVSAQISSLKQFENFRELIGGSVLALALDIPFVVLLVALLFAIGGPVGFIAMTLIVCYFLIAVFFIPYLRIWTRKTSKARSEQYHFMLGTLSKLPTIRNLRCEHVWFDRLEKLITESSVAKLRIQEANRLLTIGSSLMMNIAGGMSVIFGAMRVMEGALTVGGLIFVTIMTWRVIAPIQQGFLLLIRFSEIVSSIAQFDRFMRLGGEDMDDFHAPMTRFEGRIEMERVSFRYQGAAEATLINSSLTIEPGEIVAITGHSGCGKSTILKLILGLYQPQSGSIRLDGTNSRQIPTSEIRANIGYLQQDPRMFHGTIAQNLRFCAPGASNDELIAVTRDLGIHDYIMSLPDGFDTRLNEANQSILPGPFRQSLGLAMAVLRRLNVVLLDDPPRDYESMVDDVFARFVASCRGKTTVLMTTTHPHYLQLADKVFVLKGGQLLRAEFSKSVA